MYSIPVVEVSRGYDGGSFHKFRHYVARLTPMDPSKPWPTDEFLHAKLSECRKSLNTWCEMPPEAGRTDRLVKVYALSEHPKSTWRSIVALVGLQSSNAAEDVYYRVNTAVAGEHHDRNFPRTVNLMKVRPLVIGAGGAGGSASALVSAGAGAASRLVDQQAPALHQLAAAAASVSLPPCPVAVPRAAPANEVQRLREETENLLKRIAGLNQTEVRNARELAKANARITELDAELVKQEEEIGTRDGRIVLAGIRLDEAKARVAEQDAELAKAKARIAELETELAQAKASNADLQGLLDAKDARIAGLDKQVRDGASEANALQNQVRMTDAHRTTTEAENADLRAQLARIGAGGAGAAVVIDVETQEENRSLREHNSRLRGDLGVERALVSTLHTQLRGTKRKLDALEKPADDDEVEYMGTTSVKSAETKEIGDDDDNNGGAAGAP